MGPPTAGRWMARCNMGQPEPPKGADNSFIPRNISATLLGQGEVDERPILEELNINFGHIVQKTRAVMWPRRSKLDAAVINDSDFAGPILFALLLGTLLLFNGKVQFATSTAFSSSGCSG